MSISAGLDVGGAHLKVARTESGRVTHVEQIPCPLWQGMPHLDQALAAAEPLIADAEIIAITMTGELSDLFTDRREGVETLVRKLDLVFGSKARFWMGRLGFGTAADAVANYIDVASTNFLATATLVARQHRDALLIDMGSTTTDIIAITDGASNVLGLTDADRLATFELVYTGLTRTAVMGVATSAEFRGRRQGLCREYLATMADVRRILGHLPDGLDQHATADGRGKSVSESIARLARMFGRDAADGTADDWRAAAAGIAEAQLQSIAEGCEAVIARAALPQGAPVVAAGIGAGIIAMGIAHRSAREAIFFGDLTGAEATAVSSASHCAPAVAVALL
ncbi:MAG: hydantoinase/oxoprolinase family protein [Hyphomicrobiaceae bacterium]|nr:hydantoinase/oxoprolinase family protein [Hyphomicrobiaceae bacterium]